jgi:hypothetical protein
MRRAIKFLSGLDVSMERTAICVVDDKGEVQTQTEIVTDPDAVAAALKPFLPRLRRAAIKPARCPLAAAGAGQARPAGGLLEARRVRGHVGSATRPTRRLRWRWRISCAPAGSARPISRRRAVIGSSFS